MNQFAGTITLENNIPIPGDFNFDYIESLGENGKKTLYVFGETQLSNSDVLLDSFSTHLGELYDYDISISTEDAIKIFPFDYEEEIYEVASFEGEHVNFKEISARFEDSEEVFCIRESEDSSRFGNRIIRVDFVY